MDEEVVPFGQNVQVVDPDVRGYVYSLVTAVSLLFEPVNRVVADGGCSWEASMARMRVNTLWEMMHWHACGISNGG